MFNRQVVCRQVHVILGGLGIFAETFPPCLSARSAFARPWPLSAPTRSEHWAGGRPAVQAGSGGQVSAHVPFLSAAGGHTSPGGCLLLTGTARAPLRIFFKDSEVQKVSRPGLSVPVADISPPAMSPPRGRSPNPVLVSVRLCSASPSPPRALSPRALVLSSRPSPLASSTKRRDPPSVLPPAPPRTPDPWMASRSTDERRRRRVQARRVRPCGP